MFKLSQATGLLNLNIEINVFPCSNLTEGEKEQSRQLKGRERGNIVFLVMITDSLQCTERAGRLKGFKWGREKW